MKKIILASASPRRKELLEQIGLEFEVEPSNSRENMNSGLPPHEIARILSLEKARAVAERHPEAIVIAADTFIVFGKRIMGKAHTPSEAKEMLTRLNGKEHLVITGFTVLDKARGKTHTESVETKVRMKKMTAREIDAYVRSGEPIGKAGAYAIQELGSVMIEGIEGDYFNVVGLPLAPLAEGLKEFGVRVL
ncbi:MAG: septum formation inhibitor Maf [Chloroflexi bacterium]|nr:septum formation inhibitor Maf [Chloroflexota bacterium]